MEWTQLLRIALGQFRIPPDLFWSLTPYELGLIMGRDFMTSQINRAALAELEARFATTGKECSDEPCATTERL